MLTYTREDGCRAWLAHAYTQPKALHRLMDEYGNAEQIYEQTLRDGGKTLRAFLSEGNVKKLVRSAAHASMHEMMVSMQQDDMRVISTLDTVYPPALRFIADPPAFLFARGDPEVMSGRCLAVVGSRKASPKASSWCEEMCRELSNRGVTIVSGLAVGMDTCAHEGSLLGKAPGIGVMACGLDVDYPTRSRDLKRRLLEHGGLLLSEYPPGTQVWKGHFPVRNRIISGLCKGVVIMEGRIASGSVVTVQHALDQGREVFAWPGEPGSTWSEGPHQLLREGARYFVTAEDLLEDLGWDDIAMVETREEPAIAITPNMQRILAILYTGEKSMDELAYESGMDISALSTNLTILQMSGAIRALPGKRYCVI